MDQGWSSVLLPRYHPSRDLIAAFATGELSAAPALAVGLHIDVCAHCAGAVAAIEDAEGRLMESLEGSAIEPDALAAVLARLDAGETQDTGHASAALGEVTLPAAITQVGLAPRIDLGPDTWIAHLDTPRIDGWRTYVFCGPAMTALPSHGHHGDELIAVIEGAFSDGRDFKAGDFAENKAGFEHAMQVSPEGRMVCLIASAGPIAWRAEDRGIGALLDI